MKKKQKVKLKLSNTRFELNESKTIARVIDKGKLLAEITICSDGLFIKQTRGDVIKWK